MDSTPRIRSTPTARRRLAGLIAASLVFRRGRRLFEENSRDINLRLSKLDKLWCGGWLILRDYSTGDFPPQFLDQASAHAAEVQYGRSLPGMSFEEFVDGEMRKPIWTAEQYGDYSRSFARLLGLMENVAPKGRRILELGCGSGWVSEYLALAGYSVVGTSISPDDIESAEKRATSVRARGIRADLSFQVAAMESVHQLFPGPGSFDVVLVFEALHHAFDWRMALRSAHECLLSGGSLIIANEPNVLHSFISYRGARLTNTHEVGLRQSELLSELRNVGFRSTRVVLPRLDNRISSHWIMASK